eukprot:6665081-Prymnesium_polylepis.2
MLTPLKRIRPGDCAMRVAREGDGRGRATVATPSRCRVHDVAPVIMWRRVARAVRVTRSCTSARRRGGARAALSDPAA